MSVPSALVLEAISTTEVNLYWTNSLPADGTLYDIKRIEHGGVLAIIATTAANANSYSDTGLTAETYYDYNVCASGTANCATLRSVVTAICGPGMDLSPSVLQLIRASEVDNVNANEFNQLADQVETALNQSSSTQNQTCLVCSVNGAVTFDCSQCLNFIVELTENINSITLVNCDGAPDGNIDFEIGPGDDFEICGWPDGFGNEGGECKDSHSGGSGDAGNTIGVGFSSTCSGVQMLPRIDGSPSIGCKPHAKPGAGAGTTKPVGGGGGGGGGALSLTCQTGAGAANSNCSIDCASGTSTPKTLRVVASGGFPPYVFTATGGLTVTSVNATTADITPPANTGGAVAGIAYTTNWMACSNFIQGKYQGQFNCDDSANTCGSSGTCVGSLGGCANVGAVGSVDCTGLAHCEGTAPATCSGFAHAITGAAENCCTNNGMLGAKLTCDIRTAPMIAANCGPCGSTTAGKIVTVTDAILTAVSKSITV